jgi:uncharacterized repeat protein (TIGR03803 family)
MKKHYILISLLFLGILSGKAQFTAIHNFNDTAGGLPHGSLTYVKGKLYGMTYYGGKHNDGCVFSIKTNGTGYTDIYDFSGADGKNPFGDLLYSSGVLYGMTFNGGGSGDGIVFSIDTSGNYSDVYDFYGTLGQNPYGDLAIMGNILFGMTTAGGSDNYGNMFSVSTTGYNYRDLLNFNGVNGGYPQGGFTVSGTKLFAMSTDGGSTGFGCIFSIDSNGKGYKDLHDFSATLPNGSEPSGNLTLSGGVLYGMAYSGGANDSGTIFSIDTNGTNYTDLYDFTGASGYNPYGSLAKAGNILYGMTNIGGAHNDGTMFSININGSGFTKLLDFNRSTEGANPQGSLTISGNMLYGMAVAGGLYSYGVIFGYQDTSIIINSTNTLPLTTAAISIYPNPSNGVFTVVCHSERSEARPDESFGRESLRINIYNLLGQNVLTKTLGSAQGDNIVDMSEQPNGVYPYRVIDEAGNPIGSGELMIQK